MFDYAASPVDMQDFYVAADALVEVLPDAQRTVILGAGHLAPLEQPQAFYELLLRVLSGWV